MAEGDEDDEAQKTEEPTPKKLEESRKKGQIPLSREVNNWMMLLAGTVIIAGFSSSTLGELKNVLRIFLEQSYGFASATDALALGTIATLKILALPILGLTFIAFIAPFIQVGPLFAPEVLKPKIEKISPLKGFKRLFSMRSIMEFLKGLLKIGLVALVGVLILYPFFDGFEHLIDAPIIQAMDTLKILVIRFMIGVLIVIFIVAMIDLIYQRQEHYKKMRMTKQEVKDEYKQTEGDPHVRARLRQLRAEKARQRMMQAVPEADVVITNPTHYAIALKYDSKTMNAPLCVAKGIDELAQRIKQVANENNVEVVENKPLARALYDSVELDETIPTEHFKAVAEVISFVFKKQGKAFKK